MCAGLVVSVPVVAQQAVTTPAQAVPDPYIARPRVFVLTDIANEPDDQMSLVRLLVYADGLDIEGLVATTSTWMRNGTRVDVIRSVLDAYAQVQPRLATHAAGYPTVEALRAVVAAGQPGFGM
uniref:nucleoside hydrolase-like domain-containing protein n=1 Tax=Luteitalea sp. TaxID=2004800 RepID=UPI0037CBB968